MNRRTLVSFDWALKRLLRNKANFNILSGFLSELLFDDICVEEILESEGNQDSDRDKFNRLDLLCPNQRNEFIIIEVQYHDESDYFHRCLYGTSKVITEYINKGEPYHQVKKVYSVNILYFDLGHGDDYIYVGKTKFTGLHNKSNLTLSPTQQKKFDKSEPFEIFPEYILLKINNI
ncbi:MAG: PD-(D/E)XK nuclease family transposase [Saprospiraceae bacterium]|jgi:predicted transposase/invertase (TIGR01784 family)|nr:PD-(D/E)XK nuclease family transposase [Saprospiraceae bacterium]MBX7180010.1 Rpn family recombination-promoting nuclease/putative transposase [Saprospiraceae bacterium]MCB0591292.1 PD-(D/E)XK nuclease family transposase [Saprospiraceae bacterium]MCO5283535.1 Rpn family recombination-promoting nuclease/putative transposase [Saprospiraceae bacterium]MCO6470353.1 PD-(D/E)XK nuclease family transposase [Saprospiraceae bacterium]